MKKFLCGFLALVMCLSLVSCFQTSTSTSTPDQSTTTNSDISNDQSIDASQSESVDTSIEVSVPDESDETDVLVEWFQELVDGFFAESDLVKDVGEPLKEIVFDNYKGFAIQYPFFDNKEMDDKIEALLQDVCGEFKEQAEEGVASAICVDYLSAKSGKNNAVIFDVHYISKDEEASERRVYSINFDKNGDEITADSIFRDSYREIVRDALIDAAEDDDELKDLLEENDVPSITNESDALETFIVGDSIVSFIFLSEDDAITTIDMPKTKIRSAFINASSIPRELDPSKKMIALTYDDGPDRQFSTMILDVLEQYGVVATFFELGEMIPGRESILQREVELGCEVGSHSWDHKNMLKHSLECLAKDKAQFEKAFKDALGYAPTLFRPPYGNVNDAIGELHDMAVIGWTLDTLDWQSVKEGGRKDVDALLQYFVEKHEAGKLDGQVALMHSIYRTTAEATALIVPFLLDKGYQLVTVSELITYKLGKDIEPGVRYYSGYIIRDNTDCDCE